MLDGLRRTDDPGIPHPERLAQAIDMPISRRRSRRPTLGEALVAILCAALVWLVLIAF